MRALPGNPANVAEWLDPCEHKQYIEVEEEPQENKMAVFQQKWRPMMIEKVRVAGYAKLAKLWDNRRDDALLYHQKYYADKYADSDKYELAGVYVDITGNRQIAKRPEMIRLLRDCKGGKVECIAVQTRGYLAADTREFCYLFKTLRALGNGVDVITEDKDYNIDTTVNAENQLQELIEMAEKYISLNPDDYKKWCAAVMNEIQ